MHEPPFRCPTKKALDELAIELNLKERVPYWDSTAAYSYTTGNPEDIQQYLNHYHQLDDDDKKFTLMEIILDSLANQSNETDFLKYWKVTESILTKDYLVYEFTVHYWKGMTSEFERSDIMTPLIHKLITQNKAQEKNQNQFGNK